MIDNGMKHAARPGDVRDVSLFIVGAAALAAQRGQARRTVAIARLAARLAPEDGMGRYRALSYAGTLVLRPWGCLRRI